MKILFTMNVEDVTMAVQWDCVVKACEATKTMKDSSQRFVLISIVGLALEFTDERRRLTLIFSSVSREEGCIYLSGLDIDIDKT